MNIESASVPAGGGARGCTAVAGRSMSTYCTRPAHYSMGPSVTNLVGCHSACEGCQTCSTTPSQRPLRWSEWWWGWYEYINQDTPGSGGGEERAAGRGGGTKCSPPESRPGRLRHGCRLLTVWSEVAGRVWAPGGKPASSRRRCGHCQPHAAAAARPTPPQGRPVSTPSEAKHQKQGAQPLGTKEDMVTPLS